MINNVVLVGRLTREVDLRQTQSGTSVANFTLACDRNYRNAQGETETDFINCVMWRRAAENFARFTRKGSLVGVEGNIQTRNYENNQGQRVYVTEVLVNNFSFLEPKSVTEQRPQNEGNSGDFGGGQGFGQQPADPFQNAPTNQQGSNPFAGGNNNDSSPFGNRPSFSEQNPFQKPKTDNNSNDGEGSIDISDDDLPF